MADGVATSAYTRTDTLMGLDHVALTIQGRVILRDVCATVTDVRRPGVCTGQVVCFLGPSGIGKSTLSRIIAGLQAPTSGRVVLADGRPSVAGSVGMVAQNYPLFEFATVWENFQIAARATHGAADRDIEDLASEFGLKDYLAYYPSQLSGGTRQRVAIVRQLVAAQRYLILDEPFSGLDPLMKRRASELLRQVADRDDLNTVIVVTHDVTEGLAIADTCWLMGREPGQPGARLVEQYDLAAMGLAWHPDLTLDAAFLSFVATVKDRFRTLA